jgi:thiol-disulfide isomerase/thioredoxin
MMLRAALALMVCLGGAIGGVQAQLASKTTNGTTNSTAATAPTVLSRRDFLDKLMNPRPSDTVHVINFWATWCAPCVAELPVFSTVASQFDEGGAPVKMHFVSLDGVKRTNAVAAFMKKHPFPGPVYVLDAGTPNSWIDSVTALWSGSIPATVTLQSRHNPDDVPDIPYDSHERRFYEGELDEKILSAMIWGPYDTSQKPPYQVFSKAGHK